MSYNNKVMGDLPRYSVASFSKEIKSIQGKIKMDTKKRLGRSLSRINITLGSL